MAKGISIAALILSIFFPPIGLILGIIALHKEREAGESGTMAIIAIVLGAIWTLLSVFVVIAGFAAFGVFNPQRFAQERCVGESTGFACTSSQVATNLADDTVAFEFMNGAGERVRITSVSVDGSCGEVGSATIDGASLPVELAPNDEAVLEVACRDGAVREGKVFDETFDIGYDIVGGVPGLDGSIEVVVMP